MSYSKLSVWLGRAAQKRVLSDCLGAVASASTRRDSQEVAAAGVQARLDSYPLLAGTSWAWQDSREGMERVADREKGIAAAVGGESFPVAEQMRKSGDFSLSFVWQSANIQT